MLAYSGTKGLRAQSSQNFPEIVWPFNSGRAVRMNHCARANWLPVWSIFFDSYCKSVPTSVQSGLLGAVLDFGARAQGFLKCSTPLWADLAAVDKGGARCGKKNVEICRSEQ